MEIIGLEIENIKKIKCISLQPKSGVIKITGKNKQGKTSLLDSIKMAFAGARAAGKQPIREGEDKGTIEVDLGDMVIKRTITDKANTVTITSSDGSKFDRPQDLLNKLYNKIAFNLKKFIDMSGAEQYSLLKDCLGVGDQIEKMEADHKELFEERALLNKQIKTTEGKLHGQKADDTIGCDKTSVTELADELEKANAFNDNIKTLSERIEKGTDVVCDNNMAVKNLERDLSYAVEILAKNKVELEKLQGDIKDKSRVDTQDIRNRMSQVEETNAIVDRNIQVRDLKSELKDYESETKSINDRMDKITAGIKETMEGLDMPIPGLTMAQGDVLLDGIPVDQISDSEKLRVSMAIGVALNPELRVILITDASLLDDESMAEVEKLAAENDYQIWMEIVDSSGKVGIVIEEGEVIPTKE